MILLSLKSGNDPISWKDYDEETPKSHKNHKVWERYEVECISWKDYDEETPKSHKNHKVWERYEVECKSINESTISLLWHIKWLIQNITLKTQPFVSPKQ